MSIAGIFDEIADELEREAEESLSADEKKLHQLAQRLLRLERDLKVPGANGGQDARIDRILEEIATVSL